MNWTLKELFVVANAPGTQEYSISVKVYGMGRIKSGILCKCLLVLVLLMGF